MEKSSGQDNMPLRIRENGGFCCSAFVVFAGSYSIVLLIYTVYIINIYAYLL